MTNVSLGSPVPAQLLQRDATAREQVVARSDLGSMDAAADLPEGGRDGETELSIANLVRLNLSPESALAHATAIREQLAANPLSIANDSPDDVLALFMEDAA